MKISPQWVRDFVDAPVDNHRLAEDLTSAGLAVEGIYGEGERTVFDVEITTNRPDAMNHYGVARECSAIYDLPLEPIKPDLRNAQPGSAFPIEIEDKQGCARFTALILRDVKIAPSPATIVERLGQLDQRPISNAVDATNYVLWEIGKPTHVFDLDLIEGGKMVVRRAREGEALKTLDGVERKLTPEDLVVADAKKPVGLAGVMGGFHAMITDRTRNILIESAWWDPLAVRKMSRRHGLHTDASHRFERGADFEATVISCQRVAELIQHSGGGNAAEKVIDVIARRIDQAPIVLQLSEVRRILGAGLDPNEIVRILRRLGFDLIPEPEAEFTVQIPSWRLDVEREIDLIEEITRIHGYDKFANTLPSFTGAAAVSPREEIDNKLRTALIGLGYNEAVSLSFISKDDAQKFSARKAIELANPLSDEASVMRTSLVAGMLDMLAYNLNRGNHAARLFEAGNVFEYSRADPRETRNICLGTTAAGLQGTIPQTQKLDISEGGEAGALELFRSLKGDVETLLDAFDLPDIEYRPGAAEYYHPQRSAIAMRNGAVVAQFGQISAAVAANRKLKQDVYFAELNLDVLYRAGLRVARYKTLPRYPAVERDFSFIFDESVTFEAIAKAVAGVGLQELRDFSPAEIFRGGSVPAGKYSLLLRATFQSMERTLREDEVAGWSAQIVGALRQLGGTQRT
jgi:phenylalanyl-tRNA synthetase beta chain